MSLHNSCGWIKIVFKRYEQSRKARKGAANAKKSIAAAAAPLCPLRETDKRF